MATLHTAYEMIRDTVSQFLADQGPRLGAALAFYVVLSLAPLLLVVAGIAGLIFGEAAASGELVNQFRDLMGDEGAKVAETALASGKSKTGGVLSTVIGVVILLVGSTGVFAELQGALNAVWNVPERKSTGQGVWQSVWQLVRERLLSFSMVCGLAFLLLVSLVLSALLAGLNGWLGEQFGITAGLGVTNFLVSLVLAAVLFAVIFKVLPDARVGWRSVWVGAVATAALFNLGKFLIGLYLGKAAVGSAFGAAGSLVVLIVWVYYSTQLMLLGAEFTQVYALRYGHGVRYPGQVADEPPRMTQTPTPAPA
jgi:membrane protein